MEERRGGKKGLRMSKKRGEDKERFKNLDERRGGEKGLRLLKRGEEERKG